MVVDIQLHWRSLHFIMLYSPCHKAAWLSISHDDISHYDIISIHIPLHFRQKNVWRYIHVSPQQWLLKSQFCHGTNILHYITSSFHRCSTMFSMFHHVSHCVHHFSSSFTSLPSFYHHLINLIHVFTMFHHIFSAFTTVFGCFQGTWPMCWGTTHPPPQCDNLFLQPQATFQNPWRNSMEFSWECHGHDVPSSYLTVPQKTKHNHHIIYMCVIYVLYVYIYMIYLYIYDIWYIIYIYIYEIYIWNIYIYEIYMCVIYIYIYMIYMCVIYNIYIYDIYMCDIYIW